MQRVWHLALGGLIGVAALAAMVLIVFVWYRPASTGNVPANASGSEYEGTELDGPAPDFRLVDQNGASVSLSDYKGKVVALTLLDPDCTDICPIYAYQYRLAYQALGEDAAGVVFLALNANNKKTSVADVMAATRKWGMDEVPIWHYLTGSPEELKAVWDAYSLLASGAPKPDKPNELQHSPANFIIDQAGQERWYISTNFEGAPPLSALIVKHVQALLEDRR